MAQLLASSTSFLSLFFFFENQSGQEKFVTSSGHTGARLFAIVGILDASRRETNPDSL
jgi:hypothetical protein